MGKKDNLAAGLMTAFIIIILLLTAYFCVDIFGIVDIPKSISLTRFFGNTTEEIIAPRPVDEFQVTEDNIDEWINDNKHDDEEPPEEEPVEVIERIMPEEEEQPEEQPPEDEEQAPVVTPPKKNNATNKMYYYQLDIYGKMIYDRVYDNIEKLKTGTYVVNFDTLFNDLLHEEGGDAVLEEAFQFGMNALLFDHPEIFFLDITKMYMSTEITSFGPLKTYRVSIGSLEGDTYLSETFFNEQSVNMVTEMLETIKSNVRSTVIEGNTYDIVRTVHDYLIDTMDYDKSLGKDNIYNIYGALINREAVCEGYAKSLKYILDDFGIPCVIVCGIGQNSNGDTESHAWNYVRIDENWYAIDATWDDPVIVGDGYVSQNVYTKYFLKGSRDFFVDHTEDGKIVDDAHFVYPTLSEDNY